MEYPSIEVNGQKYTMKPPKARLYATIRRIQEDGDEGSIEGYAKIIASAFRDVPIAEGVPNSIAAKVSPDWVLDNLGGGELIGIAMQIMKVVNDTVSKEFDRFPDLKNALERVEAQKAI